MHDSNWTLRFPRSSKEAYGHQIRFDEEHTSFAPWLVVVFFLGLTLGLAFSS